MLKKNLKDGRFKSDFKNINIRCILINKKEDNESFDKNLIYYLLLFSSCFAILNR